MASAHILPLARARCSARMAVKVAGMCWVIRTGTEILLFSDLNSENSACGPPVELPIASTLGVGIAVGRRNVTGPG